MTPALVVSETSDMWWHLVQWPEERDMITHCNIVQTLSWSRSTNCSITGQRGEIRVSPMLRSEVGLHDVMIDAMSATEIVITTMLSGEIWKYWPPLSFLISLNFFLIFDYNNYFLFFFVFSSHLTLDTESILSSSLCHCLSSAVSAVMLGKPSMCVTIIIIIIICNIIDHSPGEILTVCHPPHLWYLVLGNIGRLNNHQTTPAVFR